MVQQANCHTSDARIINWRAEGVNLGGVLVLFRDLIEMNLSCNLNTIITAPSPTPFLTAENLSHSLQNNRNHTK